MKNKIAGVISALLIALTVTACGGESEGTPSAAESSRTAAQENRNSEGSAAQTAEKSGSESQTDTAKSGSKILVAYFSRADENYNVGTVKIGNTQIIAEYIAAEVGADSFHIETVTPYPANYKECCDVAKQELADKARPKISGTVDLSQYDTVFLGYPIWWGDLPMAVYTFIERYDWSGKTVIPFNTHEGSGASGTYAKIADAMPGAAVPDGIAIKGKSAQEFSDKMRQSVRDWLDGLGF